MSWVDPMAAAPSAHDRSRRARGNVTAAIVLLLLVVLCCAGQAWTVIGPSMPEMLLERAPEARIVPCCLDNSWRLMEHGFLPIPFGVTLRFWVGDPVERVPGEESEALIQRVEARIGAQLAEWRKAETDGDGAPERSAG